MKINFTTCTLRYWKADWLEITGLKEHWIFSQAGARITDNQQIVISTEGITRLKLNFRDSEWPQLSQKIQVLIDGELIEVSDRNVAPSLQVEFIKREQWQELNEVDTSLRKRPGLQGPIDDAFCDRFSLLHLVNLLNTIRKNGLSVSLNMQNIAGELSCVATFESCSDAGLPTESMIKENHHLICFGDFTGNLFLKKIKPDLPILGPRIHFSRPIDSTQIHTRCNALLSQSS